MWAERLERIGCRWPSTGQCEGDTTKMRLSAAAMAMRLGGPDPAGVQKRIALRW